MFVVQAERVMIVVHIVLVVNGLFNNACKFVSFLFYYVNAVE